MIADRPSLSAWMIGGVMLLLASLPALAGDTEDGGNLLADALAAQDKAAASSPAARSVPSSLPSSQPSSQPAEETWPPGWLMKMLEKAGARKGLDDAGIRVWGYTEAGFTGDLTNGQKALFGRFYDARRPNNARLNQIDLTVDRPYDPSKPFDIGGRVDALYGGDAMLTHALGLNRMGDGDGENWFDPIQFYLQPWFKTGKDSGLEVTLGKFLELAGSESAETINNPLYSHSYIYSFAEPTTHTGAMLKYYLNSQVFGYFGVVEGWDTFKDNNDAVTYIAGGGWSSKDQVGSHPKTQVLLNMITGPEQASNSRDYRTLTDIVINYWWNEKLSESLNIDWVTEENIPSIGRANAYGPAHYLTYVFNDRVSATWRTEWFRDDTGVRIGRAGNYYENTVGLNLTPWPADDILKNLSLRPEVRWDNSDQRVFGNSHDQMTVAFDVIFKF